MIGKALFIPVLLVAGLVLQAQIITTDPVYATVNDEITVYYNAALGNLGLLDYAGTDVYAHTGLITDKSSSPTDWKFVLAPWSTNLPKARLEKVGTNLWKLTIGKIRDYYPNSNATDGNIEDHKILKLAFVFRNSTGTREGKDVGNADIFYTLFEPGISVVLKNPVVDAGSTNPRGNPVFLSQGESVEVYAVSAGIGTTADSLKLLHNQDPLHMVKDDTLKHTIQYSDMTPGMHLLQVVAIDNGGLTDTLRFFLMLNEPVTVGAPPGNAEPGIEYPGDNRAVLKFLAPGKQFVYVLGDFNNWQIDPAYQMKKSSNDPADYTWWLEVEGLTPGAEYAYQYVVDGNLRVADPYSQKVLDPWNDPYISAVTYPGLKPYPEGYTTHIASVLQPGRPAYAWKNTGFVPPPKEKLVIYELLLRDFLAGHDWKTLADTLDYLERLGVNAIEIMPANEFEGNLSWGYNTSFYFSMDKYYGPENDFRAFVDSCHGRGIAVIHDMVLNHTFGQSPMVRLYWDAANNRPAADNPWYNPVPTHDYNVGYDFNHDSPHTRYFVKRVLEFWISEYRVDGFRFDLSKGFTQKNTLGNVAAWGAYDASRVALWKLYADYIWGFDNDFYVILEHFADNTEEKELAEYGMMLWGNMNYDYAEAAMGYASNLTWASSLARGWNAPNLITYMESHDEERLMYKTLSYGGSSGSYDTKTLNTALKRMETAAVFLLTLPGPKMIWQFGELGYDVSINYNGRTGEKPIRWEYLSDARRLRLYNHYGALISLRKDHEVFSTSSYSYSLNLPQKRINLNHAGMNVTVLGNFGLATAGINPAFQNTGKWYEYFSGDSIQVTDISALLSLLPGEYRIYTTKRLKVPDYLLSVPVPPGSTAGITARAYPNPLTDQTTLDIRLQKPGALSITVNDILGRQVRIVADNEWVQESRTFTWDGKNGAGQAVSPGVYFVRAGTANEQVIIRLIRQQ